MSIKNKVIARNTAADSLLGGLAHAKPLMAKLKKTPIRLKQSNKTKSTKLKGCK
jgi:hypothetical protein